jgi:hypothetical protein
MKKFGVDAALFCTRTSHTAQSSSLTHPHDGTGLTMQTRSQTVPALAQIRNVLKANKGTIRIRKPKRSIVSTATSEQAPKDSHPIDVKSLPLPSHSPSPTPPALCPVSSCGPIMNLIYNSVSGKNRSKQDPRSWGLRSRPGHGHFAKLAQTRVCPAQRPPQQFPFTGHKTSPFC